MKIGDKIKRLRTLQNLTLDELAEKIDTTKQTIHKYENGIISNIPSDKIELLAKVLNTTPQYLMGWEDKNTKVKLPEPMAVRTIPIYGDISCGGGLFVDDNVIDYCSIPTMMLPNKSKEYYAQYANGDSMINAGINHGDLIIFVKDTQLENGDLGCFCIDDGIATLKKFSINNGEVYLLPANDKYAPIKIDVENECFRIVGKMVLRLGK